jgi:cAMP phosphodiesterase
MSSFRLVVLGAAGGPVDRHTSAYLVRAAHSPWTRDCAVAIDAGTLVAGLKDLYSRPDASDDGFLPPVAADKSAHEASWDVLEHYISAIYLTHPHFDHIAGLVINSAGLSHLRPMRLAGLTSTLHALRTHVFNNVVWPNLTDDAGCGTLTLDHLVATVERPANDNLAVEPFPVSHGHNSESTVYLIRDCRSGNHMLIWGDVEPDSVARAPRNITVWRRAAELLLRHALVAVLVECSYPHTHGAAPLFGHMSPQHLIDELKTLATLVGRPCIDCPVVITHVKERFMPGDASRQTIKSDLETLAKQQGLTCNFLMAHPGMCLNL